DERSVIPVLAHVPDGGGHRLVGRPGVPLKVETNRAPAARQRRVAAAGQEEGVGQRVGRLGHAGEGQREPMWAAREAPLWGGRPAPVYPSGRAGGRPRAWRAPAGETANRLPTDRQQIACCTSWSRDEESH